MIEKITPLTIVTTCWAGWLLYTTIFDYRRYRFNTLPYLYPVDVAYVRQIELDALGKVYRYKEHLTKSMYE